MSHRTAHALVALVLFAVASPAFAQSPTQPSQPAAGPGGAAATSAGVTVSSFGNGVNAYTIFEPASPAPASAPLVAFVHGYGGVDPAYYRNWIDHIVKRGNIVVYPAYQTAFTIPSQFEDNAANAILAAIGTLQSGGHVQPQLDKFALAGHSAGGFLSLNLAATAATRGLPFPRVIMSAEPGRILGGDQVNSDLGIPYKDYSQIPASVLMVLLVGDNDTTVGQDLARHLWDLTPQIPAANKDLVRLATDNHGAPSLLGDHAAPQASATTTDSFDFYGMWKLFDGLADAAFTGVDREYALGGTPQQRNMGLWSDGVPVQELRVLSAPDTTPGIYSPSNGVFSLDATLFAGPADVTAQFGPGGAGWMPIAGDWDGDGNDTIGLYDPATSTFYLRNMDSPGVADVQFGYGPAGAGWVPIAGDWNGDGVDTIGLYAPSTGVFYLKNSNAGGPADLQFGYGPAGAGWKALAGDWDGDGRDSIGLFNSSISVFYLKNTNGGGPADLQFQYGPAGFGWVPLAGDWNGDGRDTVGLYDGSGGLFYLKNTSSGGNADAVTLFGPPGATPLAANWELRCNCGG